MQTLKDRIIDHIKASGPMSVASYMSWCLLDPKQGYYPTRDPLGIDGDFITAPEISQMFGEVLGLWMINAWREMGKPKTVQLVEYGPGRGVMMSDILRTARLDKAFFAAIHVHLIEMSSALEGKQAETLANCGVPVNWVNSLENVPAGPTLVIGNEYLDCLPVRQMIMKDRFKGANGIDGGWHERMVDVNPDNPSKLIFSVSEAPISKRDQALLPAHIPSVKDGDLLEINPGLGQIVETLRKRFADHLGAALFIDYGPAETELGDTFQALKKHEKVYPLDAPGTADLTARVDFAALGEWAMRAGLTSYGPCPQGQFLSRLGIEVRAVSLSKSLGQKSLGQKSLGPKSSPKSKEKIARQLHRLTDVNDMGTLFKALAIQSPDLPAPLGFGDGEQ